MADRFEDLRTFTTVLSCGGINAAAAELGIAKSAVSRRISDLEKRLGASLIERSTRRFEPTAVGVEYAARARAILAALDELDGSLKATANDQVVTISAEPAVIRHVLIPAIAKLPTGSARPVLRLGAVQDMPSSDILVHEDVRPDADSRQLFSTTLVMCASPSYLQERGRPADAKALDAHSAVLIDSEPTEWRLKAGLRRMPSAALVVPDVDAAAAAAIAGLGIVQLPRYVVALALADNRLTAVLEELDPPAIGISASYDRGAESATRMMVDALASALG